MKKLLTGLFGLVLGMGVFAAEVEVSATAGSVKVAARSGHGKTIPAISSGAAMANDFTVFNTPFNGRGSSRLQAAWDG